ncbi:hypothetical protein [Mesorhizobium sp. M0045]|uniref:hypothetical protein n=1 Tax=Mesorhizobium sp. M0045 TaxID=2956857 RepID=UPI003337D378
MNHVPAIAAVLVTWLFATPLAARDILFADLFANVVDDEIVVETNPGDVLVFDGGSFSARGRPLTVIAETIRVDAPSLILSHDLASAPVPIEGRADQGAKGLNGGSWGCRQEKIKLLSITSITIKVCNLEGEQGGTGIVGASGTPGAAGAPIDIRTKRVVGSSLLVVAGNGQKGGTGQQGGQGGTGGAGTNGQNRAGDVFCQNQNHRLDGSRGGLGGTGGTGGSGGPGGAGSTIHVAEAPGASLSKLGFDEAYSLIAAAVAGDLKIENDLRLIAFSIGGPGGDGGPGGPRGDGGQGGGGGKNSHCGGGGQPGLPGGEGSIGPIGKTGPIGNPAH